MRIGQKGGGGGGFGWVVRVEPGRVPGRKGAYSGKRGEGGRGADGSCASVQSMQSCPVQATLTELRRKTGKVLGPVIHAGESVPITSQGEVVAIIRPQKARRKMTREEVLAAMDKCKIEFTATWDEIRQETREP